MEVNSNESFTVISTSSSHSAHDDYAKITSAKAQDLDIQMTKSLREHYPELCVTAVPSSSAPLLDFAAAGFATAELDTDTESIFRWRGFVPPGSRGGSGQLGDAIFFAKYKYLWSGIDYIVYTIADGPMTIQYVLKEPDTAKNEDTLTNCTATDALIKTCAEAFMGDETEFVYVYDGYWTRSRDLWEEVQRASWDNVILDPKMKKALKDVTSNFFDSKELYERYSVPWKRGLIYYGPPGNGKTISIKALMKDLLTRKNNPVPTLYVRDASYTYDIGEVFEFARSMSPCMLVFEDIETIVTQNTRSYFFNEVDGLGNNDGILMVASTNYLDRLDPGLSKRPSRFDRKYKFPIPNHAEREQYCEYWQTKLAKKSPTIEFPKKLCSAIADITKGFSFAYMQEAFIASLLMLARDEGGEEEEEEAGEAIVDDNDEDKRWKAHWKAFTFDDGSHDSLDKYKLWRAMKVNVRMLREDLENGGDDDEDEGGSEDQIFNQEFRSMGISTSRSNQSSGVGRHSMTTGQPHFYSNGHLRSGGLQNSANRGALARGIPSSSSCNAGSLASAFPERRSSGADRYHSRLSEENPRPRPTHKVPSRYMPSAGNNRYQRAGRNAADEPSPQQVRQAGLYKIKGFADTAYKSIPRP